MFDMNFFTRFLDTVFGRLSFLLRMSVVAVVLLLAGCLLAVLGANKNNKALKIFSGICFLGIPVAILSGFLPFLAVPLIIITCILAFIFVFTFTFALKTIPVKAGTVTMAVLLLLIILILFI